MTLGATARESRTCAAARASVLAVCLLVASTGCYRAVYGNLEPPGSDAEAVASVPRSQSWRSFYLYGYYPRELRVDAAAECGGGKRVREIRTRQTFAQGVTRLFASSSGVNVYAPYDGEVVCAGDPRR